MNAYQWQLVERSLGATPKSAHLNPYSLNIHIKILQIDLHAFPVRKFYSSWENYIKDQIILPLVTISLHVVVLTFSLKWCLYVIRRKLMLVTLEKGLKRVDHTYLEFFNKFFFKLCTFSFFWLAVLFAKMCLPYFNSLQHKHNTTVSLNI